MASRDRRVGLSNREEGANRRVGLPPSQMGQGYGGVYGAEGRRGGPRRPGIFTFKRRVKRSEVVGGELSCCLPLVSRRRVRA